MATLSAARLITSGVVYGVVVPSGFWVSCALGLMKCRVADNLTVSEVLIPFLVIGAGLLIVGAVIAAVSLLLCQLLVRARFPTTPAVYAVVGALVGLAPFLAKDLFEVAVNSAPGVTLYVFPAPHYVPLALGGLAAALVIGVRQPSGTGHEV